MLLDYMRIATRSFFDLVFQRSHVCGFFFFSVVVWEGAVGVYNSESFIFNLRQRREEWRKSEETCKDDDSNGRRRRERIGR